MDPAVADESTTLVRKDMVDLKGIVVARAGTYHVRGEIVASGDGIAGLCRSRVKIHDVHCHWVQQVCRNPIARERLSDPVPISVIVANVRVEDLLQRTIRIEGLVEVSRFLEIGGYGANYEIGR